MHLIYFYCIFCNRDNIGTALSILLSLYFDNKNIVFYSLTDKLPNFTCEKGIRMFVLAHKSTDQCHYMTTKDPREYVYIHTYIKIEASFCDCGLVLTVVTVLFKSARNFKHLQTEK